MSTSNYIFSSYEEMREVSEVVEKWMFMSSSVPIVSILLFYLYFVMKLGPSYMRKREPFNLRTVLVVYNSFQILFNTWLISKPLIFGAVQHIIDHFCHPLDHKEMYIVSKLYNGAWWFFAGKLIDLLDTVFFVLRKKPSQVTFIHMYHHTMSALLSWVYLTLVPGEQAFFVGYLNCVVHTVMYFYYLVSSLGPKFQKYLWWKKYVTQLQLLQFCAVLVYLVYLLVCDCRKPQLLTYILIANAAIYLFLFSDFYWKAYTKKILAKD